MAKARLQSALIKVVRDIQQVSGRPVPGINGKTRPLRDLPGFDSINAVEASCELSIQLGCEIAEDVGLFAKNGQPRTIDEIVEDLSEIIDSEESITYE